MRIQYLFALIFLASCAKEVVEPVKTGPIVVVKSSTIDNGTISNIQLFNYDSTDSTSSIDESANGTIYYNNNLIISPGGRDYMSPIHLIKNTTGWALEAANYGKIIDRARNTYQVNSSTVVWANGGSESETNPTGNLYVSKTNSDNTLTWKKLSDPNRPDFYHYAATGDVDGDGNADIISYIGAETESPEQLKLYSGPNYDNVNISFPVASVFESALGFTKDDRQFNKGAGFSYGSITIADVDKNNPGNELILTSTKWRMNKYYSFIIMNYDKTTHSFKINKIIKPGGLLEQIGMGVADVRSGDFNGDGNLDLVVTMGNHETNNYSGIQVWTNDGNGNLIANQSKSELYTWATDKYLGFSNFEVGKFGGHDCVYLHFEGARYVPRPQTNLDLNPFLLISNGDNGPFIHSNLIPTLPQAPSYVKGYFENNTLRLIGLRTMTKTLAKIEFEVTDLTIRK